MPADARIAKLTNELEDAGPLGLLAAALLTPFVFVGPGEGAFTGTEAGFVWSRTMGAGVAGGELPFLIGKLKATGALFSATVAVQLEGHIPAHINILFSGLSEGGGSEVVLEIDPKIAILADPIRETPADIQSPVIGYENPEAPLQIPLPMAALEFSFRVRKFVDEAGKERKELKSAVIFHESLSDLTSYQAGIIEFDLEKVIVFPKLGDLGLYVDRLFVDFTSNGATDLTELFGEVYDPAWKGFGARELTLLFPVDEDEFIHAGAQGFLYGIDQGLSGSFNISYSSSDETKWVRQVSGEVELRNNQFVKSQLALDLNLKRLMEESEANAGEQTVSGSSDETSLAELAADEREARPPFELPANSVARCQVTFVWHELEDAEVLGFDLVLTGIAVGGTDSGLVFSGDLARAFFWAGTFTAGIVYLLRGLDKDDEDEKLVGLGLLLTFTLSGVLDVLPELEQISVTQLGFRFIHITPSVGDKERLFEAIFGFKARFRMDGPLLDALNWLANKLGLGALLGPGAVFGSDAQNIRLAGHAEVEISHIYLSTGEPAPDVARLFERKDTAFKVTKLPELKFEESGAEKGTALVPKLELVSHEREVGRQWHGLGIYLTALTGPSVSLDFPAAGLIIYFYPEPDIVFAHQLALEPGFTFLIPKLFLAKGVFDLNKPIPAFEGTQSRISVDVGIIADDPELSAKDLLDVTKYNFRFSGEVAWGDVVATEGPGTDFDFYFVQVGYVGKTALFALGPIGFFGLDLIYGKNIAPGFPGERPDAVGIADWILGDGDNAFDNVRDWPSTPDPDKWHPANIWDDPEYKTQRVAGFIIIAGSASDQAETARAEVLALAGLDEFWLAVAAKVDVKPPKLEAIAIFAYDSGSYLFRLVFDYRINEDGKFVQAKVPIEFGSSDEPDRGWVYLGHYDEDFGGPVVLDLFERFKVKFFLVYDTVGLEDFGLMPIDAFAKPDIVGQAFGAGAIFQLGPYKFGPSFLNIKLFAATGANAAYGKKPQFIVGEIYVGGYIQLKVIVFKFKLELLARLQGLAIEDEHRFLGEIVVKLNLPWPFDDVKRGFDFIIQSDDFVPLPDADFGFSASALGRLQPYAQELFQEAPDPVPIDSVIAIAFEKPIYERLAGDVDAIEETKLLLNDPDFDAGALQEEYVTDYQDVKYQIIYHHVVAEIHITHRPLGGGAAETVDTLLASWEVPDLAADGTLVEGQTHHQVLYLNASLSPELQYNTQKLGTFNDWYSSESQILPCVQGGEACLMAVEPRPERVEPEEGGLPFVAFDTVLGEVTIVEDGFYTFNPTIPRNVNRLDWAGPAGSPLRLAYNTYIMLPHCSLVRLDLALFNEMLPGELHFMIRQLRIMVAVDIRGEVDHMRFALQLTPDASLPCGWRFDLVELDVDAALLSVSLVDVVCANPEDVTSRIDLLAQEPLNAIEAIRIAGFDVLLDGEIDWNNMSQLMLDELLRMAGYQLQLRELCLARAQLGAGEWDLTGIGGGTTLDPPEPDEAVVVFIENQLFEPNRSYTVDFKIHTFARLYHVSELDGTELVKELIRTRSTTSPTEEDALPPVTFQTEANPSQDVSKYLGFVVPGGETARPYPASTVPIISLKYSGFIRKIYEKYGGDLVPRLLDIDGNEIERTLESVVESLSGGLDEVLLELLENCLPHVQTFVYLASYTWARVLQPNMRYSLQLSDTIDPDAGRAPFNQSFHTSRFADFLAHVSAVRALQPDAERSPLTNSTPEADIASLIGQIFNGTAPPFDGAVELFYRLILSQDGGRLGFDSGQDYLTYIVGKDGADPGNVLVWGIVLELVEPLIGKEHVLLRAKPNTDDWQRRGMTLTVEDYLLLRDVSGSRVIILNSADGVTFAPFDDEIRLRLLYRPVRALQQAIADYRAGTFPDMSAAEQAAKVDETVSEIRATDPDTDLALSGQDSDLRFALPND